LALNRERSPGAQGVVLGRDVDYDDVIHASTAYIRMNYDRPIALGDLAARSGCNSFQVIRAFRRMLGITPHSFLIEMRLERARELLALGQPAAEVATEVGFFDQSHLIRHFKRRLGRTPKQMAARLDNGAPAG
jgi:AraC-like DNA-binding protein